ncbi:regulator of chromosome condensation 1/beta-lactamase-inhibitor protein II [Triangularia verruculosa]|uniref:Regulator of chromosome condensation 1/beta-lactamase-inhibitor protein II n=1 Tax=Triangularia verruculosa TaxID=2587418 RepID=A0AAN6XG44_9PEZI|nr:regulator of chromosome condensation 1/beta-lactamase-inhibitor protein II [Triangularia verruculosa]
MATRTALRRTARIATPSQWIRQSSTGGPGGQPQARRSLLPLLAGAVLVGAGAGGFWAYKTYPQLAKQKGEDQISKQPEKAEILREKPRKKSRSQEESNELISPQHVQMKHSHEHPGVYAWGSNVGKVAAPDSKETSIKAPRRIPYFDGQILRDLKLERDFGVAVNEKGDLVQWGVGFNRDTPTPEVTLRGKDITKIAVSRDRVIALSSNGQVYSIPVAKADQAFAENTPNSHSSWSIWSGTPNFTQHFRTLKPANLGWNEQVVDIKSGLEHCLMLTSKGRVFSAASSTEEFPSRGQLGVPGLTWQNRPPGPYDQPHEIGGLRGFKVKEIATGDYHSLALDNEGRVFSFGDNTVGQLGFKTDLTATHIDTPSLLPVNQLYAGANLKPKVTSIAAGGLNSFFTVDATKMQSKSGSEVMPASELGRVVAETWACGSGIHGELGTGKWLHVSVAPSKVKALSDLYEYDEESNTVSPIRLNRIAVGSTHVCAVMDNVHGGSKGGPEFGNDVLFWGGNESYQLGTGKRNNTNVPVYIGALDGDSVGAGKMDGELGRNRFQLAPRARVNLLSEKGKARKVEVEQRVECGRCVSAVYSAV